MRARLSALFIVATGVAAAASCTKNLGDAECKQLVERMVDLYAREDDASLDKDQLKADVKADPRTVRTMKDACVGKMTKANYDCVMSAKSFAEASTCDEK